MVCNKKWKPVFIKRKWNRVVFSRATILSFHPVEGSYRYSDSYTTGQLVDGLQQKNENRFSLNGNGIMSSFLGRQFIVPPCRRLLSVLGFVHNWPTSRWSAAKKENRFSFNFIVPPCIHEYSLIQDVEWWTLSKNWPDSKKA